MFEVIMRYLLNVIAPVSLVNKRMRNWQNLFLINFEWFVDLCVMRILLFQLKGILTFHEVEINEQKVCETFKLYVKG